MTISYSYSDIAKMIDHALLSPALTAAELDAGCRLARRYDVASVCLLPYYVRRCRELLDGSDVQPSTTIGFPHGAHATAVKLAEVEQALKDGATELDMVINISKARSGDWGYVRGEIEALTRATHAGGATVKVIFENAYLDEPAKVLLCDICGEIGVDWVKTSTGFASGGATVADVRLMRDHTPSHVHVKAAGGVRTLDALLAMREAGANRVGSSATADILEDCRRRLGLAVPGETVMAQ
ncbi:MAG: deoxyribose-phosphate aldolase [Acidobacteria bacterium]|nr:deoxyribose-phosphate aldolase [Acidobacteriota bacterium]